MRRKVLTIFLVLIAISAAGLMFTLKYLIKPEISRDKYPFVGLSVNSSGGQYASTEWAVFKDVPLELIVQRLDNVVIGRFVNDVDTATQYTEIIIPKEDTSEYELFSTIAKESGQTLEDVSLKRTFYELLFEISESYGGEFSKGDIVTVNVKASDIKGDNLMFPTVEKGAKAVLLLKHNTYNAADFYSVTSLGYYYIDEYDRVISAEAYPSLDKYTGYKVEEFSKLLKGIYEESRHIPFQ